MNLYKLHSTPKILDHIEQYYMIPENAYYKALRLHREHKDIPQELIDSIAKDAEYSYYYASEITSKRFPEGEKAIATDAEYSYMYACHILRGRFSEGETAIATSPAKAYFYALDVIRGRFPEGEEAISSNTGYLYQYNNKFKQEIARGQL